ncbi:MULTISPECIES: hypothetical protein [unclassified Pasteurella]|uniref:hypothetical protein n=1 Tax=unclassified Pasteurella TaxID=2621516 RepID=UPI0010745F8E|nr:hypothetical protein [Pasteurella sp. 19428wF3_WM03]TFU50445.1 hypothetical protein E4T92_08720 [Pasteurella sp. WM03]
MENVTKTDRTLAKQRQLHPVFGGCNKIALGYLFQTQKCIQSLNKMGLHVANIEFDKIKPRVRIDTNAITEKLEKTGQALAYIQGNDGAHWVEYQMMVEGIKVIWRSYLH